MGFLVRPPDPLYKSKSHNPIYPFFSSMRSKKNTATEQSTSSESSDDDDDDDEPTPPTPKATQPSSKEASNTTTKKRSAKASSTSTAKKPKTTKRGPGYSTEEVAYLLECINTHLPIGSEAWNKVLEDYNNEYGEKNRDTNSIRRKFTKLHSAKTPTGDPNCPDEVREAKRIQREIEAKMESTEEVDVVDLGFGENDDEEVVSHAGSGTLVAAAARNSPPPVAFRNRRANTSNDGNTFQDFMGLMMAKMFSDMANAEERKEERRIQREEKEREREHQRRMENEQRRMENQRAEMMNMAMMAMIGNVTNNKPLPADLNPLSPTYFGPTRQEEQNEEGHKVDGDDDGGDDGSDEGGND